MRGTIAVFNLCSKIFMDLQVQTSRRRFQSRSHKCLARITSIVNVFWKEEPMMVEARLEVSVHLLICSLELSLAEDREDLESVNLRFSNKYQMFRHRELHHVEVSVAVDVCEVPELS